MGTPKKLNCRAYATRMSLWAAVQTMQSMYRKQHVFSPSLLLFRSCHRVSIYIAIYFFLFVVYAQVWIVLVSPIVPFTYVHRMCSLLRFSLCWLTSPMSIRIGSLLSLSLSLNFARLQLCTHFSSTSSPLVILLFFSF